MIQPTVRQVIEEARKIDIPSLERKGKEFNFTDVFPLLEQCLRSILEVEENPLFWASIPQQRQRNIEQGMNNIVGIAKRISTFNPTTIENPLQTQEKLSNDVRSYHANLYETLLLPQKIYQIEQLKESKDLKKMISETKTILESSKEKSEETLKSIQIAASNAGAGKFSQIFYKQACWHAKLCIFWLISTAVFIAATGYSVWMYVLAPIINQITVDDALTDPSFFEKYFLIFLTFSFFTYITHQFIKNINANMHLYSINKHRANIMLAFPAFKESANEKITEDAILLEATRTVFSHIDSGFIGGKESEKTELNIFDKFTK